MNKRDIVRLYRRGSSAREIATLLGHPERKVREVLQNAGVQLRPGCRERHDVDSAKALRLRDEQGLRFEDIGAEVRWG